MSFQCAILFSLIHAPVSDVCVRMHGHHPHSDKHDLEGGRVLAPPENTGPIHTCYSHLFERGPRVSWVLFGCCTLVVNLVIVRH